MTAATTPRGSIRFEKIDANGLVRMRNHEQRIHGDYSHVDETRSHLNRVLVGSDDPKADMDKLISEFEAEHGELNTPKNVAKPYVQFIITASPEALRAPGQGPGEWDAEKVEQFIEAAHRHAEKQFSFKLAHLSVDFDEDTIHIDGLMAPLHEKVTKTGKRSWSLSPRKELGNIEGEKGYIVHQDRLADSLKHLGIERGKRGSTTKHERPKAFLARKIEEAEHELDHLIEKQGEARVAAEKSKQRLAELAVLVEQVDKKAAGAEAKEAAIDAFSRGELIAVREIRDSRYDFVFCSDVPEPRKSELKEKMRPAWDWCVKFVKQQTAALRELLSEHIKEIRAEVQKEEVGNMRQAVQKELDDLAAARKELGDLRRGSATDRRADELTIKATKSATAAKEILTGLSR